MRLLLLLLVPLVGVPAAAVDWRPTISWAGADLELKLVDPTGQRVYATGETGLFRSDDRGATWIALSPPQSRRVLPRPSQLALTPADPDRVLAVFDDRYAYRSDDGGQTWQLLLDARLPGSKGHESFTAVAIDPDQPQRMSVFLGLRSSSSPSTGRVAFAGWYGSEDSGSSFVYRQMEPLGLATQCPYASLSVEAAEYQTGGSGRIFASLAAGCPPFFEYDLQLLGSERAQLVSTIGVQMHFVDERPASQVEVHGSSVLWRINDLLTRVDLPASTPKALGDEIESIHLAAEGSLWVATRTGVHTSVDAGDTWSEVEDAGGAADDANDARTHSVVRFSNGQLLILHEESQLAPASAPRSHTSSLTAGR
jgi:hypothetical protein